MQTSGVVVDPPVQVNPSSISVQSPLQPSLSSVFPSSHTSSSILKPSPQIGIQVSWASFGSYLAAQVVQVSAVDASPPVQIYVASIVEQSAEQPSSNVLLSSHVSPVTLFPSPQIGTQVS